MKVFLSPPRRAKKAGPPTPPSSYRSPPRPPSGGASRVECAVSSWESLPTLDGHHLAAQRLVVEDEDKASAAAASAALMGYKKTWSSAAVYEALVFMSTPTIDKAFLVLAALMVLVRACLLMAWLLLLVRPHITAAASGAGIDTSMLHTHLTAAAAAVAREPERRLSSLFLCGHLLCAVKLFHACREGDVLHATRSYAFRMALAVMLGGPSCALALSAVFESHAKSVASPRALGLARESAAQLMQLPYLGVLLLTVRFERANRSRGPVQGFHPALPPRASASCFRSTRVP